MAVGGPDRQRLRELQRGTAVDPSPRHRGEIDAVHEAVADLDHHRLRRGGEVVELLTAARRRPEER